MITAAQEVLAQGNRGDAALLGNYWSFGLEYVGKRLLRMETRLNEERESLESEFEELK